SASRSHLSLVGPDVTSWTLGAPHTSLVCPHRAGCPGDGVDGGASGEERKRVRGPPVVGEGTQLGIPVQLVGGLVRELAAGSGADKVVAARRNRSVAVRSSFGRSRVQSEDRG